MRRREAPAHGGVKGRRGINTSLFISSLESESSWMFPKISKAGGTCFLTYAQFSSDSCIALRKCRRLFRGAVCPRRVHTSHVLEWSFGPTHLHAPAHERGGAVMQRVLAGGGRWRTKTHETISAWRWRHARGHGVRLREDVLNRLHGGAPD
jgi:hypothetical protein